MQRRLFLMGIAGAAVAAPALGTLHQPDRMSRHEHHASGQMLICGFEGRDVTSRSARLLAKQIGEGTVGGVLFVKDNIGSKADVLGLTKLFAGDVARKTILAIDHEGGAVQRLVAAHGCAVLPPVKEVVQNYSLGEARKLYEEAGHALARLGFNLNLAPVVDLDDVRSPAIGHFGRSFSSDPQIVANYARAFISGFAAAGIICTLKHFPGQGGAMYDSHAAIPDGALSHWSDRDLAPFRDLVREGSAAAIMTGHGLQGDGAQERQPALVSRHFVRDVLRGELGFHGVALTDDLDMGATGYGFQRSAIVRKALTAGNDLLIIRNRRNYDPNLPASFASWVAASLIDGDISEADLTQSITRIADFRARLSSVA